MATRRVKITAPHGAHARPVAELARLALEHSAPVTLTTLDGSKVDLSSVLAVMDLALNQGDEVVLDTSSSADAHGVLDAMAAVLDPNG
ncbi:HPr family phosphocarrier protein [Microbacterium sp. A93]|uniref:HPr family phosphocarrier protein n=1 Tax=Microbacterium sp. A93 TaxID=3450716 RepID=UPI003F444B22